MQVVRNKAKKYERRRAEEHPKFRRDRVELEVDTKSDSCYGTIEWWEEIEGQDHNWVDLQC